MPETRTCEQCGTAFAPRREHARFCSARCRVAWNRQHTGDRQATEASALDWSVVAMSDATERVGRRRAADRPQGFVMISEAVWWVTIVDATLVRYHPDTYNAVLAGQGAAERRLTEGTLTGLRFVRNRMGYHADPGDFIQARRGRSARGAGLIAGWLWKPLPEPALASLPARGQEWEMARYRAYQAQLAGRTMGEIFGRAAAFLCLTAGRAAAGETLPAGGGGQVQLDGLDGGERGAPADQVGRPLGDGDRRRVGVAPGHGRHDRGVHHPEAFDPAHP